MKNELKYAFTKKSFLTFWGLSFLHAILIYFKKDFPQILSIILPILGLTIFTLGLKVVSDRRNCFFQQNKTSPANIFVITSLTILKGILIYVPFLLIYVFGIFLPFFSEVDSTLGAIMFFPVSFPVGIILIMSIAEGIQQNKVRTYKQMFSSLLERFKFFIKPVLYLITITLLLVFIDVVKNRPNLFNISENLSLMVNSLDLLFEFILILLSPLLLNYMVASKKSL